MRLLVVFMVVGAGAVCAALKCQTDDGVTEEDVKRIVRVCMRKIGDNTYGDNSEYPDNDSDDYDQEEMPDSRKSYNSEDDYRQRDRDHFRNNGRYFRAGGGGSYGDYQYDGYSRNVGGDRNRNQNVSLTEKQTERDRACIVHCFFQEMKMTNERQIPDKHKVIQVLTKDLRDRQLKEFYTNSIQECFYFLEMDHVQRQGKCEFTNRFLQCLAERARSNCDDWDNRTLIF